MPQFSELQWVEPQPVVVPEELADAVPGSPFLHEILIRRGLSDPSRARAFLDPDQYSPVPPTDFPDLLRAARRLEQAVRQGTVIGVWGDFDADGQTASAVLASALEQAGAQVRVHIPVRADESHGVNVTGLEAMLAAGAGLVVTCDTGISAHEAGAFLASKGVEWIITDHHLLPETLPPAYAIVNPQRLPEGHPARGLSGVATAYLLAARLLEDGFSMDSTHLLDLVALGSIADQAPLTGDMRCWVQRGLRQMHTGERLGLQVMCQLAELDISQITEDQIGFILAPRLNAIGRLADAAPAVELLTTRNRERAVEIATQLEEFNARRRQATEDVFASAMSMLDQDRTLQEGSILILSGENWPGGVVGIVASRLVDRFHKPAILFSAPPGEPARGSARSVEGVDITAALAEQKEMLLSFGGHAMAAGCSLDRERILEFRRRMEPVIGRALRLAPPPTRLPIDAYFNLSHIDLALLEDLDRLAPFGTGNPAPVYAARGVEVVSSAPVGRTREHLQVSVIDHSGVQQRAIWWRGTGSNLPEGSFELAFHARPTNYRGQRQVQMEWVASRPLAAAARPAILRKPAVEVLDRRDLYTLEQVNAFFSDNPGVQLWLEGVPRSRNHGVDRFHLEAHECLAIAFLPPDLRLLREALVKTGALKVILLGFWPLKDKNRTKTFLEHLGGLVKYALRTRDGRLSLLELAAATALSSESIRFGLQWLAAHGDISIEQNGDDVWLALSGGKPDAARQIETEALLRQTLEESSAFRSYLLRADVETFIAGLAPMGGRSR